MFCVTTEVCNTLFCVTIKFHWNTLMNVLQESATVSLFCSSGHGHSVDAGYVPGSRRWQVREASPEVSHAIVRKLAQWSSLA